MASTPVHYVGESALGSLTLSFYAEDSDTLAATATATEEANRKGLYIATVTEALDGLYYVKVATSGGTHVETQLAQMVDSTGICRCGDWLYADLVRVDGDEDAAEALKNMARTVVSGTVVSDVSNTESTFKTDLTNATTDFYGDTSTGGCVLAFGPAAQNEGLSRRITSYNATTKFVTLESPFPLVPAATDPFDILGRIEV